MDYDRPRQAPKDVKELSRLLHERLARKKKEVQRSDEWAHGMVRWTIGNAVLLDASTVKRR
jgi:hypothetical protein